MSRRLLACQPLDDRHRLALVTTSAMLAIGSFISAVPVQGQIADAVPPVIRTPGSGPVPWIALLAAAIPAIYAQ